MSEKKETVPALQQDPAAATATPKRVIVVGCGSIGRRHARLLSKRPGVTVELCDRERRQTSAAPWKRQAHV